MLPALPTTKAHRTLLDKSRGGQRSSGHSHSHGQSHSHVSKRSSSGLSSISSSNSGTSSSSSMIFRIEHLLPTSDCPPPAPTTSARAAHEHPDDSTAPDKQTKFVRAGVHVAQHTPRDTLAEPIDTQALLRTNGSSEATVRAYCTMSPRGQLTMTASTLRKIKLSEDVHSYNALFELHRGQVRLRVVRDIGRDEEIVAWFGEELSLLMSIPFLTPLNIQGNNRYTCHLCRLTFETPNPLKIHLALGCGRHNIEILWIRLHYAVTATNCAQQMLPLPLPLPLPLSLPLPFPPRQSTAAATQSSTGEQPTTSTTTSASPPAPPPPPPPPPRLSAFKPISPSTSLATQLPPPPPTATTAAVSLAAPARTVTSAPMSFLPSISAAALPHSVSLLQPATTNPLNAAAQIEAIVSNMGASKQGHLCIYCGKVYSRKYGLKIHIRTHTGFKPLKCKYCLRPFGDPSNLNKHVRLHLQSNASSSPAPEGYRCHLCHKSVARRRDLQRHMESRHSASSGSSQTSAARQPD